MHEDTTLETPHIPILYQDDKIIAVHKPSAMLVHRGMGAEAHEHFLVQLVRDQIGERVNPLHRIDRPTSGIVLFATDAETTRLVQQQWFDGSIQKKYLAIVRGWMSESEGLVDQALDDPDNGKIQEASSRWKALDQLALPIPVSKYPEARYTLMELEPMTGRWHQLRRHMSRISHPIWGDTTHGDHNHNHLMRDHLGWWRLMLSACELHFTHPYTGEPLSIQIPSELSLMPFWNEMKAKALP